MTAPAKGRVDLDRTRTALQQLGLVYAAEGLANEVNQAVKENEAPLAFLDRLLTAEVGQREERRVKTSLRLSGLPTGMTLGSFDHSFQPSIGKTRIETLATCQWVRDHDTVLISGPPGTGKTHLAVGLGVKAVENGFSVAFFRIEDLLHAMKQDAGVAPQRLRRKKYVNVALLVIDEVGFQPMDRVEANLFFRLVSYRYQRGSTIITTNKSVKDWPEILAGDEVMAAAVLDRLLHRCHVVNVKGRSYRLRDLENQLKQ